MSKSGPSTLPWGIFQCYAKIPEQGGIYISFMFTLHIEGETETGYAHSAWSESCACLSPTPTNTSRGPKCRILAKPPPPILFLSEQSRMSTLSIQTC